MSWLFTAPLKMLLFFYWVRPTVNVTHFSVEESLPVESLEQKPLNACFLAKCWGALQPENRPLPGDRPSGLRVLKQAAGAGAALTPTLRVSGRFSWVWNNSLSVTVDRRCNISALWYRRTVQWSYYRTAWRDRRGRFPVRAPLYRSCNGSPTDSTAEKKLPSGIQPTLSTAWAVIGRTWPMGAPNWWEVLTVPPTVVNRVLVPLSPSLPVISE